MSHPGSKISRRQQGVLRRQRRELRSRIIFIALGLLAVGLAAWGITAGLHRTALARAAESQSPVVGTPVTGGHDMSFIPPTPAPGGPGPRPRLTLPRDYYNFGVISIAGSPVEHTFHVLNTGEADLEIAAVTTSCGCTTASVSAKLIPPGESAEMLVRFDPSFHPQPGDYMREIYLYSNDPRQPRVVAKISATTH